MRRGRILEPAVAEAWFEERGERLLKCGEYIRATEHRIGATPDYMTSKHRELDDEHVFIILESGIFRACKLQKVWFGWNMSCGGRTRQFDPPGTNGCTTQKVWKIEGSAGMDPTTALLELSGFPAREIRSADEQNYAETRRAYAIDRGLVHRGKAITEASPIEACLYEPTEPIMPIDDEEDDEEDHGWR